MRPLLIAVAVAVLSLSHSARAEDVFGPNDVSAAVSADVSEAEAFAPEAEPVIETNLSEGVIVLGVPWWWGGVSSALVDLLGVGLKALLVYAIGWLLSKFMSDVRARKVQDALEVGVDHAWEDMGRDLKHKYADRKLSADERQKLRNKAVEHAKTISAAAIRAAIESFGVSTVEAKLSSIVKKRKAIASMGKPNAISAPSA